MSFLAASPSPYHAVANAAERLEKAGFRQVAETDAWDGTSGGKYVLRGGAIIAWYVPEGAAPHTPFRIVGAHTDSPNLRVKPLPDTGAHGWRQVAVEIYGGPLLNSWLDRDLGPRRPAHPAGRLDAAGERRPAAAARAPARHPPRPSVSTPTGLKLDKQRHLQPIWGLGDDVREGDLIALPGGGGGARARARSPAGT